MSWNSSWSALASGALFIGLLLTSVTHAEAGACRDAAIAGKIRQQISRLQAVEQQRQCSRALFGGFFSGCTDLRARRAGLERQLVRYSGAARACARTRQASRSRQREESEAVERTASAGTPRTVTDAGKRTYCVRKSDGYFFPAPNSQFAENKEVSETLAQCSFICDGAAMDVYVLDNINDETDAMTSAQTGDVYTDLKTAFHYQNASGFKSCDVNRYTHRVLAARRQEKRQADVARFSTQLANGQELPRLAVVPLPRTRPDWDLGHRGSGSSAMRRMAELDDADRSIGGVTNDASAGPVGDTPTASRKVRIVGDPYFQYAPAGAGGLRH